MKKELAGNKSDILLANCHFADLNPRQFGRESCAPGHHFGPAVRQFVLLHCVISGKGSYSCGGVTYPVGAGQIFRILPGEETVYRADLESPWYYCWIGFDGTLAKRMAEMPPVFTVSESFVRRIRSLAEQGNGSEYRLSALLFQLYDELFSAEKPLGNDYVRMIRDHIDIAYMNRISIEDLAAQLHLNRRYLTRLFHEETGMSIRDYLLQTRMHAAEEYLKAGLSVGETAERCGYEDMFLFSKLFKRHYGSSPLAWKKQSTQIGTAANQQDERSV